VPILTPDRRYLVIVEKAGPRLWRASNPHLPTEVRDDLVKRLMSARRAVRDAAGNEYALRSARAEVHETKQLLGERGPVWWDDGAPDLNRRLVKNTPYTGWWDALEGASDAE
jgi:hypothetical protein